VRLDSELQRGVGKYTAHIEGIPRPKYHSFSYRVFINRAKEIGKKEFQPLFGQINC